MCLFIELAFVHIMGGSSMELHTHTPMALQRSFDIMCTLNFLGGVQSNKTPCICHIKVIMFEAALKTLNQMFPEPKI